jgi:hypothetical protein
VSVVSIIVATRSSGPPASGKIIKEMPGSVASGTPYIKLHDNPSNWSLVVPRGETDMRVIVAFRNIAKATKNR